MCSFNFGLVWWSCIYIIGVVNLETSCALAVMLCLEVFLTFLHSSKSLYLVLSWKYWLVGFANGGGGCFLKKLTFEH